MVEKFLDEHPEFQLDRLPRFSQRDATPLSREDISKPSLRDGMDGFFVARMIKDNRQ